MPAYGSTVFPANNTIFIGNLDVRVTKEDLQEAVTPGCAICLNPSVNAFKIVHSYGSSYAFLHYEDDPALRQLEALFKEIECHAGCLPVTGAPFTQSHSHADVLGLDKFLYNRKLHFNPLKIGGLHRANFDGQLEKISNSEQPFNMDPEKSDLPCIHILVDDILLHIFSFLDFDDIYSCELVCRRFQSLVTTMYTNKLREYNGGCFKRWLFVNGIPDTFASAKNILRNAGLVIEKMEICNLFKDLQWTVFLISACCPNLEELVITGSPSIQSNYLIRLGEKCPKLKVLTLHFTNTFRDKMFHSILTTMRSLEVLRLYGVVDITRKCFRCAPISLKEFSCFGRVNDASSRMSQWRKLFRSCRQLEVLNINTRVSPDILKDAIRFCPNIREISFKYFDELSSEYAFPWPQLEKLKITASIFDMSTFSAIDNLNDLTVISSDIVELRGDFASLQGLRSLNVEITPPIAGTIMRSIGKCVKLEVLRINNSKDASFHDLMFCIKQLPNLRELHCTRITIDKADIKLLVKSHKKWEKKLKLTIGMKEAAFLEIERLSDANYEVFVVDTDNLFLV